MNDPAKWLGSGLEDQDPIASPLRRDGSLYSGMSEADHAMNAVNDPPSEAVALDANKWLLSQIPTNEAEIPDESTLVTTLD